MLKIANILSTKPSKIIPFQAIEDKLNSEAKLADATLRDITYFYQ